MVIGTLQFELAIPWAESLKDKRRVVRSLKDRLHRELMVSVAEVAAHGTPTVARLGVAVVTADGEHAGKVLDTVMNRLLALSDADLVGSSRQILRSREGDDRTLADVIGPDDDDELAQELLRVAATLTEDTRGGPDA